MQHWQKLKLIQLNLFKIMRLLKFLLILSLLVIPTFEIFAKAQEDCFLQVLRSFSNKEEMRHDSVGHSLWYSKKELRKIIYNAKYTDHGKKHLKAKNKTEETAKKFSFNAAQYLPDINNKTIEKFALESKDAILVPRGAKSFWKIYRFDSPIDYDQGELTHWIRVEYSSGNYHGHPMKIDRVKKYVPDAKP